MSNYRPNDFALNVIRLERDRLRLQLQELERSNYCYAHRCGVAEGMIEGFFDTVSIYLFDEDVTGTPVKLSGQEVKTGDA